MPRAGIRFSRGRIDACETVRTFARAGRGRAVEPLGDPAARARCRRQRPDRACPLLGAAVARRRVSGAERAVPVRYGALRTSVVQRPGQEPPGGAGGRARRRPDPRRLYRRGACRAQPRRRRSGAGRVFARHDDVALCRAAALPTGRRHPRLFRAAVGAGAVGRGIALASAGICWCTAPRTRSSPMHLSPPPNMG